MTTHRPSLFLAALTCLVGTFCAPLPVFAQSPGPGTAPQPVGTSPFTVVAQGLSNPRQILIDDDEVYVVEAGAGGSGPCVASFDGAYQDCYGDSGRVVRLLEGGRRRVIVDKLPSMASPTGDFAIGLARIARQGGHWVLSIGNGETPARRQVMRQADARFGQVLSIGGDSQPRRLADLNAFEEARNPDRGSVETNPAGIVPAGDDCGRCDDSHDGGGGHRHGHRNDRDNHGERHGRDMGPWLVADAGGNDLLALRPDGSLSVRHVFATRPFPAPAWMRLPPGTHVPVQSVPSALVLGPKGTPHVAEFTGVPFPKGAARVFRVGCKGEPQLVAGGFTNVIDLAFGPDGSLYVLEMATNGMASGDPTGAVHKVTPRGERILLASQGLVLPTAIAVDSKGNVYVANYGVSGHQAQIVKL